MGQDIDKTFNCLAADVRMVAQKTELWTEEKCSNYLADVKAFMDEVYLKHVYLVLKDANGNQIKARRYDVVGVTEQDVSNRPGDNNWDQYEGKDLNIILSYGYKWDKITAEQKAAFKKDRIISWSPSEDSTSFEHLRKSNDRLYASGVLGIKRIEFD